MSASGRRNPLDRLAPVAELPGRRIDAADIDPNSSSHESDPDDPVGPVGPVEEPEHPGWGIGGMPTWLDAPPSTPPTRPSRRRMGDLDGVDEEYPDADDDDPVPRRRFAVAPPAALALIAVGVVVCAVAALGLFRGSESAPVVDFGAVAGTSRVPESSAAVPTEPLPAQMVVSVVGLVHKPGLVRLAPDARVAEAIDRAGGARKNADLLSLNLAQVLRDGDQILVGYAGGEGQMSLRSAVVGASGAPSAPSAGEAPTGTGTPASGAADQPDAGGLVNLNTATEADLDELPGVGPVTAKAILSWRDRNGRFTSVDQLAEVDGIGPARLARLRDLVTV